MSNLEKMIRDIELGKTQPSLEDLNEEYFRLIRKITKKQSNNNKNGNHS